MSTFPQRSGNTSPLAAIVVRHLGAGMQRGMVHRDEARRRLPKDPQVS